MDAIYTRGLIFIGVGILLILISAGLFYYRKSSSYLLPTALFILVIGVALIVVGASFIYIYNSINAT